MRLRGRRVRSTLSGKKRGKAGAFPFRLSKNLCRAENNGLFSTEYGGEWIVVLLLVVNQPVGLEHVAQHIHLAFKVKEPVRVKRLRLLDERLVDRADSLGNAAADFARLGGAGVVFKPCARVEQAQRRRQIVPQEGAKLREELRALLQNQQNL